MMAARLTLAAVVMLGVAEAAAGAAFSASKCSDLKSVYQDSSCCGNPDNSAHYQVVPVPATKLFSTNICAGKKPTSNAYFNNINCTTVQGVVEALEQAGANVTAGYQGQIDATGRPPITTSYLDAGLCPVNVHWHLGTEHLSMGEYDETGTGPSTRRLGSTDEASPRTLAGTTVRQGFRCKKYDGTAKFTTVYTWKHCTGMHVGETYEVHWPHSKAGACGTPYQYQSPFYDGVFCTDGLISLNPLNTYTHIGVQSQVFTIVNDENYYYPDLMRGAIVQGTEWFGDVAKYTGSTTGTSRSNTICSKYTPITWQVDRKCHLISASSFDKMCADMKSQSDDMSSDLHAHGSRELVSDKLASNNHQRL